MEHLPLLKELEPSLKQEVQGYVQAHLREVKEKAKRKYAFRVIGSVKDEKMIMELYQDSLPKKTGSSFLRSQSTQRMNPTQENKQNGGS